MILIDAGPLVAIVNRADDHHAACVAALDTLPVPFLTTWPAFTEAMYLLGSVAGWISQDTLWKSHAKGNLEIAEPTPKLTVRSRELMAKYQDVPMDLADASLVALAEDRNIDRIFSLDGDFEIYRLTGRRRFKLIPG